MLLKVLGSAGDWPDTIIVTELHKVLPSQPDIQSFLSGIPSISSLFPRFSEGNHSCLFMWIGVLGLGLSLFFHSSGVMPFNGFVAKTVLITHQWFLAIAEEFFSFSRSAPALSE